MKIVRSTCNYCSIACNLDFNIEDNGFIKNIQEAISTPDYIIRDKHAYTGLIIKRIQTEEGFLQIVLRLCTSGDEHGYKNSVISCWKISERRLQNYLRNKEILYSRE